MEKALGDLGVSPRGKVCLDIGASTGGFTECLLRHGAVKVYAVDVGYGILHERIRRDSRVVVLERTNARYLTRQEVPEAIGLATVDVVFISVLKVLPALTGLLRGRADVLVLVKPNFELPARLVEGGVVQDPRLWNQAVECVVQGAKTLGLTAVGSTPSDPPGAKGNREFFVRLAWQSQKKVVD